MSAEVQSTSCNINDIVSLQLDQNDMLSMRKLKKNRANIVLLTQGTVVVSDQLLDSYSISAPSILLLNELEYSSIIAKNEIRASVLSFHPSIMNERFDDPKFRHMNQKKKELLSSWIEDAVILYPVLGVEEYRETQRWLKLRNSELLRAKKLMNQMDLKLKERNSGIQREQVRRHLKELLFMIGKLVNEHREEQIRQYSDPSAQLFQQVLIYFEQNYDKRITLDDLSKKFGLNRNLLNQLFHKEVHQTPMQYLITFRIQMACNDLINTKLPVTEIAMRSGFCDLSHFGRTFKKYMQCSPHAFREQSIAACECSV